MQIPSFVKLNYWKCTIFEQVFVDVDYSREHKLKHVCAFKKKKKGLSLQFGN